MGGDNGVFEGEKAREISDRGALFNGAKVFDIKTAMQYFPNDSKCFLHGFKIESYLSNMSFVDSHLLDFAGRKNYKLGLYTKLYLDESNNNLHCGMSFDALEGNYHMWRDGHLVHSYREFGRLDKLIKDYSREEVDALQKLMLRNHRIVGETIEDLFLNNQVVPKDFLNKCFQSGDVLFRNIKNLNEVSKI